MTKKVRFYQIELLDGHGCERRIIAAQSKASAKNIVDAGISHHQKVQAIKPIGWHQVNAQPDDENNDVAFVATIGGNDVKFTRQHASHGHLMNSLPNEANDVRNYMNRDLEDGPR